ncbi:telomere length regulation protein TEL2 homolog [Phymastichus coffea]|uniref:telomere length regulation protein TEL2 homolog n=1 Tax=Phymastichus coffea TaxID=108790 RepID=UPI00273B676D|nr:telomere length regulation protein TEL2 homolog [Phymastichus coffea]
MMNMWKVRELMDKATNVMMNYTDTEAKVREATNDDAWGPTGAMMQELAQATFTYEQFPEVMSMLWKRMLQDNKRNWRRTYKSLLLLNYLVRNGSERVVTSSREHIYDLRSLENYTYIDDFGKDQGINIRHKVRELIDFVQDDEKLREERKKAKKNKDKYIGMSSEAMGVRAGFGGVSSGNHERWMDNPKWTGSAAREGGDGYNEWDRGSPRAKGFEDANSDDGEREDSDNETRTSPRRNPSTIAGVTATVGERREYRDTAETMERAPKPTTSPTPKAPRTIKKVDLGAAAHYGKDQQQQQQQPSNLMSSPVKQPAQRSKSDILNEIFDMQNDNGTVTKAAEDDDFDPRADNYAPLSQSNQPTSEFGDFASAFGTPPMAQVNKPKDDEFADFTSAFDSSVTISQPPSQQQQPQVSLLGATIPNIGNPMTDNLMSSIGNTDFGGGNDLFNTMQTQSFTNKPQITNNSNNNTTNTDLLSDLTSFASSMPAANNLNNANLFASEPFNNTAHRLLDTLRWFVSNRSQIALKKVRGELKKYVEYLPGTLTEQKLVGLDEEERKIDPLMYSRVLETLVETFDVNWPLYNGELDDSIKRIFVVEGSDSQVMYESLLALTQAMKQTEYPKVIAAVGRLLEELMKSDALFSALVTSSRITDLSDFEKNTEDELWQAIIQLIVSLPNRVANKMQKNLPDTFKLKSFTNLLSFHIARAIHFLNESKVNVDGRILSMLFGKMFLVLSSDDLKPLVDIIVLWCKSRVSEMRSIVQSILFGIDTHSIENLAVQILKHPCFVSEILENLIRNDNWRHTFTVRIPLMTWYNDDRLIYNLVSLLRKVQTSDDRLLFDLTIKLLDVWGDQSALNHTSFDQHLYITKLIILSVKHMVGHLSPSEKNEIQKLLFSGIPTHLGSTEVNVRAVGMITGEMLTELLITLSDAAKLKFEYDGMEKDTLLLVKALKNIEVPVYENRMDEELIVGEIEFPNLGNKRVYELGIECGILKNHAKQETKPNITETKEPYKKIEKEVSQSPVTQVEEELDSDDDLVPYDLSNDRPDIEKFKPLYLRDLRDNLVNAPSNNLDDLNVFSETLRVSEELIIAQLGNDDESFAKELLEIFLNLQDRYATEDFEVLTFKACVAIVSIYPQACAKYLCQEFHSELSKYSVQHRLTMLNVLCEAARKLSAVEIKEEEQKTTKKTKKNISKPVSLHIEIDKSKIYETLYDDDFDDPLEAMQPSVDWYEIIQQRIDSKTRRFAHETKLQKSTVNKFYNHVSSFFFPLIHGFSKHSFLYSLPANYRDQENILLTRFLESLATIMACAQNCPVAVKMAKEILELAWVLRYHDDAKVRLAVMKCVAATLLSIPEYEVQGELLSAFMEIKEWLADVTRETMKGDCDENCRELGRHVMYLVDSILRRAVNDFVN